MQRIYKYLGSILLIATLLAPVGLQASFKPKNKHAAQHRTKRYYDRDRKDWHNWDDREGIRYQSWQVESRQQGPYYRLNRSNQSAYWTWRHAHPDNY